MTTQEILRAAQGAKLPLALAGADTKNAALEAMAVALIAAQDKILDANKQDVENARGRVSDVMLDRLALTPSRLTDMAKGMREVAALPDPVGAVLRKIVRPNGLLIEKTAVPMGVIAIIYESRPTSRATPPRWPSRRAVRASCAAGATPGPAATPLWRPCAPVCAGCACRSAR